MIVATIAHHARSSETELNNTTGRGNIHVFPSKIDLIVAFVIFNFSYLYITLCFDHVWLIN
jgi:hypothetical protein